jgi:hypothetical protein
MPLCHGSGAVQKRGDVAVVRRPLGVTTRSPYPHRGFAVSASTRAGFRVRQCVGECFGSQRRALSSVSFILCLFSLSVVWGLSGSKLAGGRGCAHMYGRMMASSGALLKGQGARGLSEYCTRGGGGRWAWAWRGEAKYISSGVMKPRAEKKDPTLKRFHYRCR